MPPPSHSGDPFPETSDPIAPALLQAAGAVQLVGFGLQNSGSAASAPQFVADEMHVASPDAKGGVVPFGGANAFIYDSGVAARPWSAPKARTC